MMWYNLTKEKCSHKIAERRLREWYSSNGVKAPEVVVIDHLDQLVDPSVAACILLWARHPASHLSVICVSTIKTISKTLRSLFTKRITLDPYTHSQLQSVLTSRLEEIMVFEKDAVELAARKAACRQAWLAGWRPSRPGDARCALHIGWRAAELALAAGETTVKSGSVTTACQMFKCEKVEAVRRCSRYEQEVLRVLAGQYRHGVELTALFPLYHKLTEQLRTKGLPALSLPAAEQLLSHLTAGRLLLAKASRHSYGRSYRINIASSELDTVLGLVEEERAGDNARLASDHGWEEEEGRPESVVALGSCSVLLAEWLCKVPGLLMELEAREGVSVFERCWQRPGPDLLLGPRRGAFVLGLPGRWDPEACLAACGPLGEVWLVVVGSPRLHLHCCRLARREGLLRVAAVACPAPALLPRLLADLARRQEPHRTCLTETATSHEELLLRLLPGTINSFAAQDILSRTSLLTFLAMPAAALAELLPWLPAPTARQVADVTACHNEQVPAAALQPELTNRLATGSSDFFVGQEEHAGCLLDILCRTKKVMLVIVILEFN
jgi:hypothetical protein